MVDVGNFTGKHIGKAKVISGCEATEAAPLLFKHWLQFGVVQIRRGRTRPSPIVKEPVALDLNQPVALVVLEPASKWKIDDCVRCDSVEFEVELADWRVYFKIRVFFPQFAPECPEVRNFPRQWRKRKSH